MYCFMRDELLKVAKIKTPLLPHQQRVVDRITQPDQPGLVVMHGLGSGKTLTSIAAQEALNQPATVVVPASLHENYRKEVLKHTTGGSMPELSTLQRVARGGFVPRGDTLTIDEAHRLRESSTRGHQALADIPAKKRLLLTASPFYNHPSDISTLINLAAGEKKLPVSRADFSKKYIVERTHDPGLLKRIFTSQTKGTTEELNPKTAPELKQLFGKYVDRYPGSAEGFPEVTRQTVTVPMDDHQLKVYDTMMSKAPPWVAAKVRAGLPPSKTEAKQLNAFLGAVRQVSNTTAPFEGSLSRARDPKIRAASQELMQVLKKDPEARAVVYSNFLAGGIEPYKQKLDAEGVPYGEFTGEMRKNEREQMVRDYNTGKVRTLLLSSAGGEGLDLKGTRLMQILDPHWNEEKIKQVEGRGARYKSHSHLLPEKQTMTIQRFISTRPKSGLLERWGVSKPGKSVDEYLTDRAAEKERLIGQFRGLM